MPVSDARGCGSLSMKLYIFRGMSGYIESMRKSWVMLGRESSFRRPSSGLPCGELRIFEIFSSRAQFMGSLKQTKLLPFCLSWWGL